MTGFEKFQQKIKDEILVYMPREYRDATVEIINVQKNNDQNQVGVTIKKKGQTVAATVYLERYYADFLAGEADGIILKRIIGEYLEAQQEMSQVAALAENVKNYDSVKNNIRVQVVNKETNRESLRNCPKKEIEGTDLLAVFRILFYKQGEECGSALITDSVMDKWNMNSEFLYKKALKNTIEQAPAQVSNIMSVLSGMGEELALEDIFSDSHEIYILTNQEGRYGAATMLYPGLLQSIAEGSQTDFYILPSSIHELLLIKAGNGMDVKEIQRMVMEINRNQVAPKEFLSDRVYYYNGSEQKLSMAMSLEETKELARDIESFSERYIDEGEAFEEEEMER